MTRLLRALTAALAVALLVTPLGVPASAQSAADCPGRVTIGEWTTIGAPDYPAGSGAITEFAIDPHVSSTLYATNGTSLMRTLDGGCSWIPELVLTALPGSLEFPLSGANSEFVDIAVPESRYSPIRAYALIAEKIGPATRPHVARFDGETWTLSDQNLPLVTGTLTGIHVAPNSPNFVYVHSTHPTGGDELYASTDAGQTWSRRSPFPSYDGLATAMAIDPLRAEELWFYGPAVYHSTNGGQTRESIPYIAPPNPALDVWHGNTSLARIAAWEAETSSISISPDGGRTWQSIMGPIPGNVLDMAHGEAAYDLFVSLHEGLFQMIENGFWRDISPESNVDLLDIEITRTDVALLAGRTSRTIEMRAVNQGVTLSPFDVKPADVETGIPKISPEEFEVVLKPGQSKTVDIDLDLPPLPNPLDVFFLVDTSSSMDSTIAGLRAGMQDVVNDLAAAGLDVQFGVGEFKDYPIPGYGDPQQGDFPYRLDRIIGPPNDELKAALERLESSGGGAVDQPESQLTGLYQAATGAGQPPWVAGGQDAHFRDNSLKVIVHITDAPFHDEPQHPSPPFDRVAQALKDKGILQVGLAIYGPRGADGLNDLEEMASATNTLAPEPVDCDKNGSADIAPGGPLVCEVSDEDYDGSLNLAPAIVATLKAVTQEVGVQLVPAETPELVAEVSPGLLENVNLKEPNQLKFSVTFECPRALYGTKSQVPLEAMVGKNVEATSVATVRCKPEPIADKAKILPALIAPLARPLAALAAPPPPPPPLVEQIPGTQQMAQAQGAIATEEQEQLQVAVAQQRSRFISAKEELYEFSAYKESRPSPAPLYIAAAIMAAAYAAVHSLRGRTSVAVNRRRR